MDPSTTQTAHPARPLLVVGGALIAVLALLGLADRIDLLMPVVTDENNKATGLEDVRQAINAIKGPATLVIGSLAGLGVLGAAAMMAVGGQSGPRLGMLSIGSIAAIALGNGIVA